MNEMIKNLRFTDLTPEQKQQLLTSGVLAVVAKDPSMIAGLMRQFREGDGGAATTTRPTRPTRQNATTRSAPKISLPGFGGARRPPG
jgi:hypothetical protein